jgi:hypothetical protein
MLGAAGRHLSRPLHAYRALSRSAPLGTAFSTCFLKGSASDGVSQKVVERRECMDWRRNLVFACFSGLYLGIGQHYVYNVAFTRVFGAGTDVATAVKKVLADSFVHVPLLYLPLYYPFECVALGQGTPIDGLRRYRADSYDVLTTYWTAWPAVHFINFTIMPKVRR